MKRGSIFPSRITKIDNKGLATERLEGGSKNKNHESQPSNINHTSSNPNNINLDPLTHSLQNNESVATESGAIFYFQISIQQ